MVLIGHLVGKGDLGNLWFIHYGWTGVNLFFTLSGFLFTYLYFDKFIDGSQSLKEYFLKRVIRIYPLCISLILITVASRPVYSIWNILTHITLTHSYFQSFRYSINSPMWTLTVEESFYFLVPILFVILGKFWEVKWFKTILGKIFFITLVLLFINFGFNNLATQLINIIYYCSGVWDIGIWTATIFGRFFDFGIGITAGLLFLKLPHSKIFTNKYLSSSLFVMGIAVWFIAAYWVEINGGTAVATQHKLYSYVFKLYSLGASIMIISLVGNSIPAKLFSLKPVVYAGKVSFALYLVQYMAFGPHKSISMSLLNWFQLSTNNLWLSSLTVVVVIFILSSLLYHTIEIPAQKYFRKLL